MQKLSNKNCWIPTHSQPVIPRSKPETLLTMQSIEEEENRIGSSLYFALSPASQAAATANPNMEESKGSLSKPVAVIACITMTLFYVANLYAPTLIIRLPPPHSLKNFMIRRFISVAVSSVASVIICALVLPAPLTEELVFRAYMIPLLLCGGFKAYNVIFRCPTFFSLAHLNHMMEIYSWHNYSLLKASMVVGLQLGYTVIFGSYASFLFVRTG
ncbi:hypothetical protein CRYUN_Cryun09bG0047200 [Craigia yunnanensis]